MNSGISTPPVIPEYRSSRDTVAKRAHYSPPWADVSIIAVAGSSGSGKTTLSAAIVRELNLPWVVIMSMVSEPSK
jgi:uridine kinase